MKKAILLLLLCALSGIFYSSASCLNTSQEDPKKFIIIKALLPNPETTRSVVEEIEVWLDSENGVIEMYFNVEMGALSISIRDSFGNIHYSGSVNTNTISAIQIPAPTTLGTYTISITGASYMGSGTFII